MKEEKLEVAVIGALNIDITGAANVPFTSGDSLPGEVSYATGGVGWNIARDAALLGARTGFFSVFGADGYEPLIRADAAACGVDAEHVREILDCAACDDAVRILRECGLAEATLTRVTDRVLFHLAHRADGMEAGVLIFSKEYGVLGQSENAPELLKKIMED